MILLNSTASQALREIPSSVAPVPVRKVPLTLLRPAFISVKRHVKTLLSGGPVVRFVLDSQIWLYPGIPAIHQCYWVITPLWPNQRIRKQVGRDWLSSTFWTGTSTCTMAYPHAHAWNIYQHGPQTSHTCYQIYHTGRMSYRWIIELNKTWCSIVYSSVEWQW